MLESIAPITPAQVRKAWRERKIAGERDEVEKPCPSCGLVGVWLCTSPDCPMKEGQKTERDRWQERQNNPEGEQGVQ